MFNRIDLPLSPSWVTGFLAAAPWLLLAALCLVLAATGTWPAALVLPLLAGGALSRWRRCGSLTHPRAVTRLATRGPQLFVTINDGAEEPVMSSADSRVGGHYLVLSLLGTNSGHRFPVLLVPDEHGGNASGDALRRLRVWLRLMPAPPAPIKRTVWYKNPLQHFWPGGKPHDH